MELEQTFILQVVERSGDIESAVVHFLRYPLHLDTDNLLASESKTMELEEAYDALLQRLRGDTEQAAVQFLRLRRDEVDEVDAEDLEESGELEYLLLFEAHDATVGLGDVGVGEPLVESEDGLCLEYLWRTDVLLDAVAMVVGFGHHLDVAREQEVERQAAFALFDDGLTLSDFLKVKPRLACRLVQVVAAHAEEEGQGKEDVV